VATIDSLQVAPNHGRAVIPNPARSGVRDLLYHDLLGVSCHSPKDGGLYRAGRARDEIGGSGRISTTFRGSEPARRQTGFSSDIAGSKTSGFSP